MKKNRTLAGELLEMMKEDGAGGGDLGDPAAKPASGDPAPTQPTDNDTKIKSLQEAIDGMEDPDAMSEALDMMQDQADKYLDETDDSTYTAQSDDEKDAVTEARSKIREAAMRMRGMRKK